MKKVLIILTIILGFFTLLAAVAGNVSPDTSSIMTFLVLILPFLLVLNIIAAIYWTIRFRYWVWIPVVAIIANCTYISSMIQNPFRERAIPKTEETLKVASYNVGRFGKDTSGFNTRRIAFAMAEEQVDVLCFQEFTEYVELPIDSLSSILSIWPYSVIPKAEDGTEILPLAVYSRYPIVDSGLITFPYTPNSSMWFDIRVNDKTLRIFNNHLQTTSVNQSGGRLQTGVFLYSVNDIVRARQAETISALIKESPYPVIVAGDFNSPPSSYTYRTMKGDLKDGFRAAGHGFGYTYRYFKRTLRIDYIFYSPSLVAIDYYSPDWDYGSDHNPVMLEIEI
ncbi:endonuclease/exonuclease/phosphatase family protein [Bacteroides sp. 51]|uniref:endonuclease/exonuclease/phosphatase family protein n=1 Tax=Bacteroides sp. 51 TaxID=2302938 RepID=UPI0013D86B85|nr:endonuclease/exonuclease/phosphatase family protein [Bacteroides sp. 51]NDV82674.1 endonuclease [Bacteroides sp. 51]